MKLRSVILVTAITLITIGLQSCFKGKRIKGNNNIVERVIDISDYNSITIDNTVNLVYEQKTDTAAYLRIETDENIFDLLKISVKDSVLDIDSKKKIKPSEFNVYTNSPGLAAITTEGSSKIHLKGLVTSPALTISIAGSSKITVDSLICTYTKLEIVGSGKVDMKGISTSTKIEIAGSGNIKAFGLISDTVDCEIAGSGKIEVTAHKALNAEIAGSGNIRYKGDPAITQSIAGSGKIKKVDDGTTAVTVGLSH